MAALETFCRQVRARSAEHREALRHLHSAQLHGQVVAILRQELDSMVRTIYLLSIRDRSLRQRLIEDAVGGRIWSHPNSRRRITDREMVDLADRLHGWTQSVYRFGCAFIHLSSFHDYLDRDPMEMISDRERAAILDHMRYYHGGPATDRPTFDEIVSYSPAVFMKIADNLECYVRDLEAGGDLED